MESKKLLTYSVIVLFLLNLGTLAFLFIGKPHHPGPPPEGGPAQFLIHELSLTSDQQKQFEKLKEEHHSRVMQLQDSLHTLHEAYFHELSASTTLVADSLQKIMSQKQSSIELLTFDHFRKVRAICNAEQQKKFDKIIMEALQMMLPHPPEPPPLPPER